MHGGYHDIDGSPALTHLIEGRDDPAIKEYFHWAIDKRPEEELFDITADPGCLNNLALDPAHEATRAKLWGQLEAHLK